MNTPAATLQSVDDTAYAGDGWTMARGGSGDLSPNGNPLEHLWILRKDGEYVDYDQYRFDLAARYKLILV